MSDLSDEECQEIQEFVNTLPRGTKNVILLRYKYDKEWYDEKVQQCREMEEFFGELADVMQLFGQDTDAEVMIEYKDHVRIIRHVMENGADLEDESVVDMIKADQKD